ncbi:hypothetical protein QM298_14255 [Pseudomonas mendocina]|nr:hypothetical protein [Pseudomonas mendocina]MDV5862042.1 hypothetical protein [Pseudomonas mendocina]
MSEELKPCPFKREDRYTVIKHKDLSLLPVEVLRELRLALDKSFSYMPERKHVVIEDDWPEYEQVWAMIEARMNTRATRPAPAEQVEVRGLQWLDTGHYRKKPPQFGYNPHDWNPLMTVAQHQRIVAALRAQINERDAAIEEWSGTAVQNGMEVDRLNAAHRQAQQGGSNDT